jgi:hypothetical protein
MPDLPEVVNLAWKQRSGPWVLGTVSPEGEPNVAYVLSVKKYDDGLIVIADNFFGKTRGNIESTHRGSLLFMTDDMKAYQIKGHIELQKSGEYFDDMKQWLEDRFPGEAAAVLRFDQVYEGSTKLY